MAALSVANDGVAKQGQKCLVNQERGRVILGEGDGYESGMRDEGGDDARVQPRVESVYPVGDDGVAATAGCVMVTAVASTSSTIDAVVSDRGQLATGALDEFKVVIDAWRDIAFPEQVKGACLKLVASGGRRLARGCGRCCRARRVMGRDGAGELRGVVGEELEAVGIESLDDVGALLFRGENEVRVVGGDEENGDAGLGEGRGELEDAAGGVESSADDGEDGVLGGGKLNGAGGLAGQGAQDGLEDVVGPGAAANDRGLEGGDADVEEALVRRGVVEGEALQLTLGTVAGRRANGLGLGQQNTQDGLYKGRVEI